MRILAAGLVAILVTGDFARDMAAGLTMDSEADEDMVNAGLAP